MRLCNQWGNLLIIYALGSWYWYRKHKPKVFDKSNHKRQKLAIVCCIKRPRIQNHDLALQVLHRCFSCWSLEEIETMRSANYPPKKTYTLQWIAALAAKTLLAERLALILPSESLSPLWVFSVSCSEYQIEKHTGHSGIDVLVRCDTYIRYLHTPLKKKNKEIHTTFVHACMFIDIDVSPNILT